TAHQELLIPLSVTKGPVRSVLLHPAGGGVGPYFPVARQLSRLGPVSALRASGLLPGERPDDSVPEMTRRYLTLLDGLEEPPDLLFGWSLGGVLAWELAAALAVRGQRPRVVMIDSPAVRVPVTPQEAAALRELVRASSGLALSDGDTERVTRTTDAHIKAVRAHEVRPRHDCPTLLMPCTDEDNTPHLARWRSLAADLTVRPLPCGHFDVLTPPHLTAVLGHLSQFLRDTAPHPTKES
ncbi:alpha/beta fold hydrolase, partial [Streptomyces sp. E11-3]|uniref:alpha/beta fold hydrolase n=1 Tax=Streptomyces sp. E11-3 TaxID=3110112 RepID=UPI003981776D